MIGPPCPVYVVSDGARRYCEVGRAGHAGTHVGDRTWAEYEALRREADAELARRCGDALARVRLACGRPREGGRG